MSNGHRMIDLQRHMVAGGLFYQALCQCGYRSELGSRALAQGQLKEHRKKMKT